MGNLGTHPSTRSTAWPSSIPSLSPSSDPTGWPSSMPSSRPSRLSFGESFLTMVKDLGYGNDAILVVLVSVWLLSVLWLIVSVCSPACTGRFYGANVFPTISSWCVNWWQSIWTQIQEALARWGRRHYYSSQEEERTPLVNRSAEDDPQQSINESLPTVVVSTPEEVWQMESRRQLLLCDLCQAVARSQSRDIEHNFACSDIEHNFACSDIERSAATTAHKSNTSNELRIIPGVYSVGSTYIYDSSSQSSTSNTAHSSVDGDVSDCGSW